LQTTLASLSKEPAVATLSSFDGLAPHAETADERPRLLVLAPRYPYPIIGGDRLRIHHVCAQLAERYRLTLLCLCDRSDHDAPPPPAGIFDHVEKIVLPRWQSRLNCLLALPTRVPLQLAYYWSKAFERRVAELAPQHDAILCHLIRLAEYAVPFDMPRVLEMTDAISLNYSRVKQKSAPARLRSLIYGFEQTRLEAFERQIVDRFDAAVLVSHVDRKFLFSGDPDREQKVMICSNGVDTYELPYRFSPTSSGRIVFIGNSTTLQNFDGIDWFAREVLPRVRTGRADAVLEVVGHCGPTEAERLGAHEAVRVVGGVPSIARAAAGADVGVCPIRVGAGVQNKLLSYMALGLPSVTTSVGLEGVGARPGAEVLVADAPDTMANAVLELMTDRNRARALAEAAREFVERQHRWPAQLEPLVERLGQLLRAPLGAAPRDEMHAASRRSGSRDRATRPH
jgi:glycosyltransferase involved in cell wall biosynthesis